MAMHISLSVLLKQLLLPQPLASRLANTCPQVKYCHCFAAKENFSQLRQKWMIRRTKAIIADQLPVKDERVVYCKPTTFQVRHE